MRNELELEGPYPLIPISNPNFDFSDKHNAAQSFATEMALTHNVIIRALNQIWLNAPLVKPEDETALAGYGLTCLELVHIHHAGEEKVIFPQLQSRLDMGQNWEQHHALEKPMMAFQVHLQNVHDKIEQYDSEKLLRLLRAVAGPLVWHLHEEIPTISPERMGAFTSQELTKLVHDLEEYLQGLAESTTLFPFIMTNHDRSDAPDWPPVPTHIKWFGAHVGFHRHHQYWKFSPFTIAGEPQNYYSSEDER
ncbi:hypothetical protein B0H34DRAFT_95255 [Crassisporium funariophilum]|nr:hypothetical protein B0H34DRAFT_95255 [Crassisporium funariophilum]